MNKVKVSKKVFEELEAIMDKYGRERSDKSFIISYFVQSRLTKDGQVLHSTSFIDFAEMIVNGYELEETKLEIISKRIKEFKFNGDRFSEAYVDGALDVLDALDLKIEGVNA